MQHNVIFLFQKLLFCIISWFLPLHFSLLPKNERNVKILKIKTMTPWVLHIFNNIYLQASVQFMHRFSLAGFTNFEIFESLARSVEYFDEYSKNRDPLCNLLSLTEKHDFIKDLSVLYRVFLLQSRILSNFNKLYFARKCRNSYGAARWNYVTQ
jgi:hypothetical protein